MTSWGTRSLRWYQWAYDVVVMALAGAGIGWAISCASGLDYGCDVVQYKPDVSGEIELQIQAHRRGVRGLPMWISKVQNDPEAVAAAEAMAHRQRALFCPGAHGPTVHASTVGDGMDRWLERP